MKLVNNALVQWFPICQGQLNKLNK